MVYLLGVNLPDDKLARIALTRFYGIGQATATGICDKLGIHRRCRLADVTDEQKVQLGQILGGMTIESELKREIRKRMWAMERSGTSLT
jgi:small subunit ribosomal protein S13